MGFHHDEAEEEQVPFRLEGASGADRHIVVTAAKRQWLDEHLARQWRRPPTAAESDRSVADFVREEVLYREALALGLDRDDLVVRRRLVQKMEMLALRDRPGISESDLMDHYLAHRAEYAVPESVSFRHVFFSAAARGADAHAAAGAALAGLRDGGASGASGLGDPPPMPPEVSDWTRSMVAARFGAGFAAAVFEADPGGWSGSGGLGLRLSPGAGDPARGRPGAGLRRGRRPDRDRPGRGAPRRGAGPHLRQRPGRLSGRDRAGPGRSASPPVPPA